MVRPMCSTLFPYTTLFRSILTEANETTLLQDDQMIRQNTWVEPEKTIVVVHATAMYFDVSLDRKSTRLNSSHVATSYAVFCLKKKRKSNKKNTTLLVIDDK